MSRPINFTEATYLALHAMALVAASGEKPLSIHDMAEKLQVSEAHLAKVVQRLSHAGLVHTTRGPKGGVVLAKEPSDTSYLEIFEAIEGRIDRRACVFGRTDCSCEKCVFGDFISKMAKETETWLENNTLADFAKSENK